MQQRLVSRFLILAVLSMVSAAGAQSAPVGPMPAARPGSYAPATPSAPPPPAAPVAYGVEGTPPRSYALRFTLSPEWGYRTWLQQEPSSVDKRYVASGIPSQSARVELYPLAFGSPVEVAKDFGITFHYARSIPGMVSHDIDTDTDFATQWYRFGFGARYRFLGGTRPIAMGVTLGVDRSVFDFESTPAARPVAIGRYTLLPVGADFRYAWGRFSLFADVRFLLPLTVSPPGNRTPTGARFGGHVGGGGIVRFGRYFEVEARADYTLLYVQLPTVGGRSNENAKVLDQYLVFSVGPTLLLY